MSLYYYRFLGEEFGPISLEVLKREIACGQLSGAHEVRCGDEISWTRVDDFVAQEFTNPSATRRSAPSILTWDGGHDDVEAVETVWCDPATKTIDQWFCRGSSVVRGPYTLDDLRSLARGREILADDEVSFRAHGPWTTVESMGCLMAENSHPTAEDLRSASPAPDAVAEVGFKTSVPVSTEQQPEPRAVETKTQWYARMGQAERGPMEFQKLIDMVAAGHILPADRIRQSGQSEWVSAHSIPGLFSSYSSSNRSVSPSSLTTTRPSLTTPVMPVSVQHPAKLPSPLPTDSMVQQPALALGSAHSQGSERRTVISFSSRLTELSQQTLEAESKSPLSQTERGRPVEMQVSAKPLISRRPRSVSLERKARPRSIGFEEPHFFDRKTLILIAGTVLLLFVGRSMIPVSTGQFEAPYKELKTIYDILDEKWSEKPTIEFWMMTRKEFVHKIESVKQKVKNLSSEHLMGMYLISACEHLILAAKSNLNDEVVAHMQVTRSLLVASSKELEKSKELKNRTLQAGTGNKANKRP